MCATARRWPSAWRSTPLRGAMGLLPSRQRRSASARCSSTSASALARGARDRRRAASGAMLDGLREFREHLGGELTVTLLAGIGAASRCTRSIDERMLRGDRLAQRSREAPPDAPAAVAGAGPTSAPDLLHQHPPRRTWREVREPAHCTCRRSKRAWPAGQPFGVGPAAIGRAARRALQTPAALAALKRFLIAQRLLRVHAQRLSVRRVPRPRRQGGRLPARLARPERLGYTDQLADSWRAAARGQRRQHQHRALRLQAAGHGPRWTRSPSTCCATRRISSASPRTHRQDDRARARARAVLLPRNDRRDGRVLRTSGCSAESARRGAGRAHRPGPAAGRGGACAATSACASTPATQRSSSKIRAQSIAQLRGTASRSPRCSSARRCASRMPTREARAQLAAVRRAGVPAPGRRSDRTAYCSAIRPARGAGRCGRRSRAPSGASTSTCRSSSTEMQHFDTTQAFLSRDPRAAPRASRSSQHLEVETYTWDVLPPSATAIAI